MIEVSVFENDVILAQWGLARVPLSTSGLLRFTINPDGSLTDASVDADGDGAFESSVSWRPLPVIAYIPDSLIVGSGEIATSGIGVLVADQETQPQMSIAADPPPPPGMSIDAKGTITITGSLDAVGSYSPQITVSGAANVDSVPLPVTIQPSPCTLAVTAPDETTALVAGDPLTVRWTGTPVSEANVTLSLLKGGMVLDVFAPSTPNDGEFAWTLPATLPTGSDYTIRIADVDPAQDCEADSAPFSVVAPAGFPPSGDR